MKRLSFLALAIFFVSACATKTIDIDYKGGITASKMSDVKVGVTTRDDLTRMFGEPETKMHSDKVEIYFFKDLNLRAIWVAFDKNWVVKDFHWTD